MSLKTNPLNEKQLVALSELTKELTPEQAIWVSGYLEGRLAASNPGDASTFVVQKEEIATVAKLTILYGTETGNAKDLAERLAEKAAFKNIEGNVVSMYDFNYKKLKEEENLAIIVSTHGEGDPPDMADDFYKYLTGTRAPKLENVSYSVLALGDKSYKYFCKTGEDIDSAFKSLGAYRMASTVKCDVEYERDAEIWMNNLLLNIRPAEVAESSETEPEVKKADAPEFSKKNPFLAAVLEKVKITGRDSDKEVYHVELSLEGSGLTYEPGDSLGIFTKNPNKLVQQILEKADFSPDILVDVDEDEISIADALAYHFEITVITYDLLKKYFEITKNKELEKLINDDKLLDDYLYGHDLLDLLEDFPFEWNAKKLAGILRPLPPRLYSISSSQKSVEDEVHATISVVRYEKKDRERIGACSSHVGIEIDADDEIPIYIDKNPGFKLPPNGSKIIMVGAGTGIAPYRAFLQQRESLGMLGDTWLFFGDRHFNSDFLYQAEWQKLLKSKHLEKMDVAFSRDQEEKIYVQHKMKENQEELFEWIENGAYFYVCGDMKNMAKDVNLTLLEIIQTQGGVTKEKAEAYFKNLKKEKRFQADVY